MSYKLLDIMKGGVYSALNINGKLKDQRIKEACSKCFAFHDEEGKETGWCDSKRSGCACKLEFKGRVTDQKCPNLIWYNNVINLDKLEEFNAKNNFTKK